MQIFASSVILAVPEDVAKKRDLVACTDLRVAWIFQAGQSGLTIVSCQLFLDIRIHNYTLRNTYNNICWFDIRIFYGVCLLVGKNLRETTNTKI